MHHRINRAGRRPGRFLLATVLALGLTAAACGSDDDGDADGGGDAAATTVAGGGTETTAADSGGDTNAGTTAADAGGDTAAAPAADEGEPTRGGNLVIGLIAESSQGFTPSSANWAISGHMVARALFDTLLMFDAEGNVVPNLLESIEPNADSTVWTLKTRPGITFHNGEAWNGDALFANLDSCSKAPLTAPALFLIDSVAKVDETTVTVTMKAPWVAYDTWLAGSVPAGQCSNMVAPAQIADTQNGPRNPIGTGPFVFERWDVDQRLVATKNPNYWKTDAQGQPLPYLDGVEFRIIPDHTARRAALVNGEIDIMQTDQTNVIAEMRGDAEDGNIELVESQEFVPTGYWMINNAKAPLDDVRVRRAMAHAINRDVIIEARGSIWTAANGPFVPGSMGYVEDTGYPEYDPEAARALVDEYEAEVGPISVQIGTVAGDAVNLENVQFVQAFFSEVGIDAEIVTVEEQKYIGEALVGNFDIYAWRNHAGTDPDQQYHWWSSLTASPIGELALNFGRFKDPEVDALLNTIRSNPDDAARQTAAEDLNRRFGDQVFNLWFTWTVWGVAHTPQVHGLDSLITPDGQPAAPIVDGQFYATSLWKDA